jgi:cytochrome c oxidase subunit IV
MSLGILLLTWQLARVVSGAQRPFIDYFFMTGYLTRTTIMIIPQPTNGSGILRRTHSIFIKP